MPHQNLELKYEVLPVQVLYPEIYFYVREGCPICKKVDELIIAEIKRRTTFNVITVNATYTENIYIRWWKEMSTDIGGEEIAPMIVIWDNGFMHGSADIYIVEKKNYDIITKTLTEKILALAPKIWMHIEKLLSYGGGISA